MSGNFKKMWEIADIPIYILISWGIISLIATSMFTVNTIVQTIVGLVILVGAFGFIGYSAKEKEGTVGYAAKTGAFAGVIYGAFGAILGLVSYYYFPQLYTEAINQATAAGTPVDMVEMIIKFSVYFGIIWMPLLYAGIGAGLSALGGLINKK